MINYRNFSKGALVRLIEDKNRTIKILRQRLKNNDVTIQILQDNLAIVHWNRTHGKDTVKFVVPIP